MRTRVWSLVLLGGLRIWVAMSCGAGCRHSLDPVWLWLWLWHRVAAAALIQPLASFYVTRIFFSMHVLGAASLPEGTLRNGKLMRSFCCGSVVTHLTRMRMQVWSLASLSGLKIGCCLELWGRSLATVWIRPLAWKLPYASSPSPGTGNEWEQILAWELRGIFKFF